MKQIELFRHWLARITAKYLPKEPQRRSEFLDPSQQDKISPSSPFTYEMMMRYLPRYFPKTWQVSRSFVGWTNSMEPVMDHGDMLLKIPYEEFKRRGGEIVGQIAIYNYGDARIVHRCIERLNDGRLAFKGDNNFRADPPVRESQIADVVIGILYTKNKLVKGED